MDSHMSRVLEYKIYLGRIEVVAAVAEYRINNTKTPKRVLSTLSAGVLRCILVTISGTEHEAAVLPLSPIHHPLLALSTQAMSRIRLDASSSSSNFQSVLNAALDAYEKKTKNKLLTHPLAAQLQSCDSPTAILSVLEDITQQFDRRRRSDERLTNWLNPTINVLYTFSSTLGQGVGLVSLILLSSQSL
jgi:hypothetical protein